MNQREQISIVRFSGGPLSGIYHDCVDEEKPVAELAVLRTPKSLGAEFELNGHRYHLVAYSEVAEVFTLSFQYDGEAVTEAEAEAANIRSFAEKFESN